MLTVSELYVYPIKSMGGVALDSAVVSETGFQYDRFWMLVDNKGDCLTQREIPQMALFAIHFVTGGIEVSFQKESIIIPFDSTTKEDILCHIWEDSVMAIKESAEVSSWFSQMVAQEVFLVRMAESSIRYVKRHAPSKVFFPDSAPFMILGQSSLDFLNSKLANPLPMDRFRPNIVFKGGDAHEEDEWQHVKIGELVLKNTKLCARCTVTTIDQQTGQKGDEPLLSLSKYRLIDKKIMFGHYFKPVSNEEVEISIGDRIDVLKGKP